MVPFYLLSSHTFLLLGSLFQLLTHKERQLPTQQLFIINLKQDGRKGLGRINPLPRYLQNTPKQKLLKWQFTIDRCKSYYSRTDGIVATRKKY